MRTHQDLFNERQAKLAKLIAERKPYVSGDTQRALKSKFGRSGLSVDEVRKLAKAFKPPKTVAELVAQEQAGKIAADAARVDGPAEIDPRTVLPSMQGGPPPPLPDLRAKTAMLGSPGETGTLSPSARKSPSFPSCSRTSPRRASGFIACLSPTASQDNAGKGSPGGDTLTSLLSAPMFGSSSGWIGHRRRSALAGR